MELRAAVKKVERSNCFRRFIKENHDYYLAHCFTMFEAGDKKQKWEVGYYSPRNDKLVVFETEPRVVMRAAEDALKKKGLINRLDMSKVRISSSRALKICHNLLAEQYPNRSITKSIVVLQSLDREVFNITLVTISFDIINIKVDAESGEVISHNLQSIMNLGRWEKGERPRSGVSSTSSLDSSAA